MLVIETTQSQHQPVTEGESPIFVTADLRFTDASVVIKSFRSLDDPDNPLAASKLTTIYLTVEDALALAAELQHVADLAQRLDIARHS